MTTLTAQESSFDMDEGIYKATLDGWEEVGDNGFGPGLKLIWSLDDETKDDGDHLTKWQFVSQKLTPRSNLWGLLKTLGSEPVLGNNYELAELCDPLIGTKCDLVIKEVNGPKGPSMRIAEVMLATPKTGARKAAPGVKATAVAETLGDCFICDEPGEQYDNRGRIVCPKHAGKTD